MQITSGMAGALGDANGTIAPDTQSRIASDYRFNIAYGATVLAQKLASVPTIGDGDPTVVENWYYALWAYNGWGWMNNPNNTRFSRSGNPVTNPSNFPYQERVLYLVSHPPRDRDGVPLWSPVKVTLPSRKSIGAQPHALPPLAHPHRQIPPVFSAVYRSSTLGAVQPGTRKTVTVNVTNTGTAGWGTAGTSNVSLTYHLLAAGTDLLSPVSPFSAGVLAFGQGVVPIAHSIPPGKSVTVRDTVTFPSAPGRYLLLWDMQQGTDVWFSQTGGFPRAQPFEVVGPGSPAPTAAGVPTPTVTPPRSLRYVADTSIRDGSTLAPGQRFTKGWLVFNDGAAAWGQGWSLHLVSGKSFGATTIPAPTLPHCRAWTITVKLRAPGKPGRYASSWRLRTPDGLLVGDRLTLVVNVQRRSSVTPTPIPPPTPTSTPAPKGRPTPTPTPAG